MIIESKFVRILKAAAVTICPIIFVDPELEEHERRRILIHEWTHNRQQYWFGFGGAIVGAMVWLALSWPLAPSSSVALVIGLIEGWVAGQLLWRLLYLLVLPFWWNPFRRYWETQAFLAEGKTEEEIARILKDPPYYLR